MTLLKDKERILQTDAHQRSGRKFPAASYSTIISSVNTPPS